MPLPALPRIGFKYNVGECLNSDSRLCEEISFSVFGMKALVFFVPGQPFEQRPFIEKRRVEQLNFPAPEARLNRLLHVGTKFEFSKRDAVVHDLRERKQPVHPFLFFEIVRETDDLFPAQVQMRGRRHVHERAHGAAFFDQVDKHRIIAAQRPALIRHGQNGDDRLRSIFRLRRRHLSSLPGRNSLR